MALTQGSRLADRRIPSASSYTVSFNNATAGSDQHMFVVITCPATTVSSVTYAGSGMTLVQRRATPYSTDWTVWRLATPATGTNNLVVTMAAGNFNGVSTFIQVFSDCDGVGNTGYNGTQTLPITANITLLANSMVIGCVLGGNATNANVEIPIGTARTLLYNHNVNNFTWGSVSPSLSAGTITCEGNSTATMVMMLTEVREKATTAKRRIIIC